MKYTTVEQIFFKVKFKLMLLEDGKLYNSSGIICGEYLGCSMTDQGINFRYRLYQDVLQNYDYDYKLPQ